MRSPLLKMEIKPSILKVNLLLILWKRIKFTLIEEALKNNRIEKRTVPLDVCMLFEKK